MEGTIRMSRKERNRLYELRQVLEGKETIKDAQMKLGGSYRQARRRFRRFVEKGDKGLCHLSRGRPSNRTKAPELREDGASWKSRGASALAFPRGLENGRVAEKATLHFASPFPRR